MVRLFAQTEIAQQRAGQDTTQWQGSLAGYLLQIAAAGNHPHLATALADQGDGPEADGAGTAGARQAGRPARWQIPCSSGAMTRILTGLLPPTLPPPAARR